MREPKRKIINPDKIKETTKTVITTTDWSNIPHYPTNREKRENVVKYLMKMGRQVPPELLKQLEEDRKKEIEEDSFNLKKAHYGDETPRIPLNQNFIHNEHIKQIQKPLNKFSPQYANYIGVRPKAQSSARFGLGGLY